MDKRIALVILFVVAVVVASILYPFILKFARKHKIYDNPNARKLQRQPIPVMGGMAVWVGIIVAMVVSQIIIPSGIQFYGMSAMTIMLLLGCWDDLADLSPTFRLGVETLVIWLMMSSTGASIDNFHGLWGLHEIPQGLSIPLSIFAGVGIINAINLMDGVNGYSSGFGILSCILFGVGFLSTRNFSMGILCFVTAGALIPFYIHNVFGQASRMFIGDGGTLMLGTLLSLCVFCTLSSNSPSSALEGEGMGLVAFSLAVMSIPVFDTLKVMGLRIARRKSPFHPDKTHLHHLYIDCGFSHVGTSTTILTSYLFIVFVWWLTWRIGVSIDWQLYIVIALSLLDTAVFYYMMHRSQARHGWLYRRFVSFGILMHINQRALFKAIRKFVDHKSMGVDYSALAAEGHKDDLIFTTVKDGLEGRLVIKNAEYSDTDKDIMVDCIHESTNSSENLRKPLSLFEHNEQLDIKARFGL